MRGDRPVHFRQRQICLEWRYIWSTAGLPSLPGSTSLAPTSGAAYVRPQALAWNLHDHNTLAGLMSHPSRSHDILNW